MTANAEHAVRAFEFAAVDYLLEPVTQDRLLVGVQRARTRLGAAGEAVAAVMPDARDPCVAPRIVAKQGGRIHCFEFAEVARLRARDKYVDP